MDVVIAIGTRKGLWLAHSPDGREWSLDGPHLLMREVSAVGFAPRRATGQASGAAAMGDSTEGAGSAGTAGTAGEAAGSPGGGSPRTELTDPAGAAPGLGGPVVTGLGVEPASGGPASITRPASAGQPSIDSARADESGLEPSGAAGSDPDASGLAPASSEPATSAAGAPWATTPRLLAGMRSEHWGPSLVWSDDLGASWHETEQGSIAFPEDTGTALARVWQLQPDVQRPGLVWAGCEPTSLWRSSDGGEHFELVRGLWDHPHRPQWGPGYGGAAVHTVVTDPADENWVLVAMSAGGVYRSTDGGASFAPSNTGISAYFLPDPNPEFGQCVHKVAADASGPQTLFAQNHHGVYRSDDRGSTWQSIADGLPSDFGFVALAHPRRSGVAWMVPLVADGERVPPGGRLRIHRTEDGGGSWKEVGAGLPDGVWTSVLRDAACVLDQGSAQPALVALGTRDGSVYASVDDGDTMVEVARHLPDVLSLRAAVVA